MDSKTLRSIIYDLKEKNPKASYETIASMVYLEYGLEVSRQHCRTAYIKEAENRTKLKKNADTVLTYVAFLKVYGYNNDEIIKAVKKNNEVHITSEEIDKLLEENEEYTDRVYEDTVANICGSISEGKSPYQLRFGTNKIKRSAVNDLIASVMYKDSINNIVTNRKKYRKFKDSYYTALKNIQLFIGTELEAIESLDEEPVETSEEASGEAGISDEEISAGTE